MRDLLAETARLVEVASVSRGEGALADLVEQELRGHSWLEVVRIGDNVIARTTAGRTVRLVLAGHLDTVPPSGNERARLDGDVLYGIGAADMKGGVAVMLAVAGLAEAAVDTTFVFYACEEISRSESGLLAIAAARPELLDGDAAILLEPTSALVEAGCQGVVKAEVTLNGVRAHVARPWVGTNAIHKLGPLLDAVATFGERRPVIDGCVFRESLQAVLAHGGHAANVVPDCASLTLSYRFAPDLDVARAFDRLGDHLLPVLDEEAGDTIALIDSSPAALPSLEHHLLAALVERSGRPPQAKLGWTDVAFFAERGVPGTNFGPGDPLVAHCANEHVSRSDLESCFATLVELLAAS